MFKICAATSARSSTTMHYGGSQCSKIFASSDTCTIRRGCPCVNDEWPEPTVCCICLCCPPTTQLPARQIATSAKPAPTVRRGRQGNKGARLRVRASVLLCPGVSAPRHGQRNRRGVRAPELPPPLLVLPVLLVARVVRPTRGLQFHESGISLAREGAISGTD